MFIQAKRRFYPFDICPGYWAALCWHAQSGIVASVESVRDELERGGDDLWDWVKEEFGAVHFLRSGEVAVRYTEVAAWVQAQTQFTAAAKAEFLSVADGWLVAAALLGERVIVTLEEHKPDARSRVPLPNVALAFDIEFMTPFEMLRRLGVSLNWKPD